jgi:hypothetical protein
LRVLPENDLATFCFPSLIFGFGFGFGFGRRRCRREFQNYSSHTAESSEHGQRPMTCRFECSISAPSNLRTLSACVQALSKHGKELLMEAAPSSLTLRCINEGQTAFCSYEFRAPFFDAIAQAADAAAPATDAAAPATAAAGPPTCCKLPIKSCLAVFRTLRAIERLVISLVAANAEHVVVFCAHCKHGIVKTHKFHYEEVPVIDADFHRDQALHRVRVRPTLLTDAMQHIHGTSQITLEAKAGVDLRIASHHPSSIAAERHILRTHIRIMAQDLDEFVIADPLLSLTFSLPEFSGLLGFCASPGVAVDSLVLFMNAPGQPLMLTTSALLRAQHMSNLPLPGEYGLPLQQGDDSQPPPQGNDQDLVPLLYSVHLVLATLPAGRGETASAPEPEEKEL